MPAVPSPLVSLPEILEAGDLGSLLDRYRGSRAGQSDDALVRLLRADWHALAWRAADSAKAPARFEPVVVERLGRTYRIFGVIHGIAGGDDRAYMDFVAAGLQPVPRLLIENGIGYYYRHPDNEWIPDFVALGFFRSAWLGFSTAFKAPLVFWDLARELVRRRAPVGASDVYDPAYHGLDPEVRRGLDPDAVLPSRLEIPRALERYRSFDPRLMIADPVACVPRSLFMAGYAVGACERDGTTDVGLLVGDLHTTEIAAFLSHREHDEHPLFVRGRAMAQRTATTRRLAFAASKVLHLGAAVLGMIPVIAPAMALAMWILGLL